MRQALDMILDGHLPYPAMAVRPHGLLVSANQAFDLFHDGVDPGSWRHQSTYSGWRYTPTLSRASGQPPSVGPHIPRP